MTMHQDGDWDPSGLPADQEIALLREALVRYGDRQRMATSFSMELQQVIDRAFERTSPLPPSIFTEYETSKAAHHGAPEGIAPADAFDMGYAWAMSLRGQTLEDSRAVGRTLMSHDFDGMLDAIREQIRERGFDSFQTSDHGIVEAKAIIRAAFENGTCCTKDVDRDGWLRPYRTMDASGNDLSAASVGWEWLNRIGEEAKTLDPAGLSIETPRRAPNESMAILYRNTQMLAFAFVMRDPMNFAVLMRWRAGAIAD